MKAGKEGWELFSSRARSAPAGSRNGPRKRNFVCVALIIDVFARRIVGWCVPDPARTDFVLVLDARERAWYERRPAQQDELIHHRVRVAQYVAIRYTGRLVEAGIEPSLGSVGDTYANPVRQTRHEVHAFMKDRYD
ncbi:transposase [Pandoraea sputorum]|uniref:Transposase n=1 Tax=Pandoraea sputorum TaxID=93222 RepID=A0A5E5BKZ5_9BURK|nr:transposase [Pandoraea sputorum]